MTGNRQAIRRSGKMIVIAAVLSLGMAVGVNPAGAEESASVDSKAVGLQAASWLLTVPYGAVKSAYAIGGGMVGGLAWVVTGGNLEPAKGVWVPSMTGDYIVQPENLTGEKRLQFVGPAAGGVSCLWC
ncbi:MAG: hypothetical protein FJ247_05020 [Nitrospira sp.]|nr:hypothetical protein [Nitrospira sp.]